jgi:hypothetical protein
MCSAYPAVHAEEIYAAGPLGLPAAGVGRPEGLGGDGASFAGD